MSLNITTCASAKKLKLLDLEAGRISSGASRKLRTSTRTQFGVPTNWFSSWVTYEVLRGDVGAVEDEGRDRLDVPGRRRQVQGRAAVLWRVKGKREPSLRRETDPWHDTYDTSLRWRGQIDRFGYRHRICCAF